MARCGILSTPAYTTQQLSVNIQTGAGWSHFQFPDCLRELVSVEPDIEKAILINRILILGPLLGDNLALSGFTPIYSRVSGNLKCDCPADVTYFSFTENCWALPIGYLIKSV